MTDSMGAGSRHLRFLNLAALIGWSVAFSVVVARVVLLPHRPTTFSSVYQLAASHWLHGESLYGDIKGFLYGPIVAVFFVPLAGLGRIFGSVTWLAIDAAVLFIGVAAVLRTDLYPRLQPRYIGIILLLVLPMAISNLDIAQANPLVVGLLLAAIAAVETERWNTAAVCVVIAGYFKIYPLVVGLLILVIAPKQFSWRLCLALIFLGLLPFLLQHWDYAWRQYRDWFVARAGDDELKYSADHAKIDLWLLLVRMGGLPVSPGAYRLIQMLSGASIALYCVIAKLQAWPRRRVVTALFSLACIWMMLCGPATEGVTYLILAAPVAFALVQSFLEPQSIGLRALVTLSYALLFLTALKNSLVPHIGSWARATQPVAALIFLIYCLLWLPSISLTENRSGSECAAD